MEQLTVRYRPVVGSMQMADESGPMAFDRVFGHDMLLRPSQVQVTTNLRGSAGTKNVTAPKLEFQPENGAEMVCMYGDRVVFRGFLGNTSVDQSGAWSLSCHDTLFYLMPIVNYNLRKVTASQVVKDMCEKLDVPMGDIEDTEFVLQEEKPFVGQKALDVINYALVRTSVQDDKRTNPIYVMYAEDGAICLKLAEKMFPSIVDPKTRVTLGVKALMGSYTIQHTIVGDTANYVRLMRPNEATGKYDVFSVYDSENIEKWGTLMRAENVDAELTDAAITERARNLLIYLNNEKRELSFDSLGVHGLRGGGMIVLHIPGFGSELQQRVALLDKVSHTFKQGEHTMSVQTRSMWVGSPDEVLNRRREPKNQPIESWE